MARRIRIAKSNRRGLGKGTGSGYRNMIPKDPKVHQDSGRGIKQPESFVVVNMPPQKPIMTEYEREFIDRFDSETLDAIKRELGDIEEIKFDQSANNGFGSNVTIITGADGSEWEMFESEDEAEEIAIEGVENDLNDNLYMFSKDWLLGQADNNGVNEELERFYTESMQNYVDDIENEGDRLIEELEQAGIIDDEEAEQAKEGTFDLSDAKDEYVEKLMKDRVDEGIDGFRSEFGDEMADKILMNNINTSEAAKDAVATDGWQHFLASYDGNSIELPNGRVMVRIN